MAKLRYSEFRDRIDIDAVESALGFTPISSDGVNDTGHCMFPDNHSHGDSTGKFAIHRDKKVYNCWVCGGGSLLSLAMEHFDLDVDQATDWLYQFATGVDTRNDQEFHGYLLELLGDIEERRETMPYFNVRVLERFKDPVDYFRTRGISDEVIKKYNLCYGNSVMKPAPIKMRDGQPTKTDDDYFGPAAIFPHYWQDKLVGWQHRWMEFTEARDTIPKWIAKYTNTTDFPKQNTLFNYDHALRAKTRVVVCESVPTVLFLASHGFPAVSYFGGEPTDAQLRLMRRFAQGVILAPDNDKNGERLLTVATRYLERFIPVHHADRVTKFGLKGDLGDYAKDDHPYASLCQHLTHRVHEVRMEL